MTAYFMTEEYQCIEELNQSFKKVLTNPPRRVDTTTKLALLAGNKLKDHCSEKANIVLLSEKLSLSVMSDLINDNYHTHQQPMPMTFINSIGNAACFYLAQLLKTNSSCQFFALSDSFTQLVNLNVQLLDNESIVFGFLFEKQLASSWLVINKPSLMQKENVIRLNYDALDCSQSSINKILNEMKNSFNS